MVRGISIGPGEVAGYLGQLRNGFEALGVPCEHFLYIPPHKFGYATSDYFLKGAFELWVRKGNKGGVWKHISKIFDKAIRLIGLAYAITRYDVFIFSGYGSFFRFLELPLLKLLKKRVIVVYLGSDARPPYLSGKHLDDREGAFDPAAIAAETRAIRRQMARVERYATVIVNHTGTAQFATRPFVRLSQIGLPMQFAFEGASGEERCREATDDMVRVLHAPSRPIAKGTHQVREAIATLRAEGLPVELIELSGVPNSEVLRQLATCDIVVDELYSDLPLATFGAEAGMFGKPVIVGSLYVDSFGADNPDQPQAPTIFIHPDALEEKLRVLVLDEARRREEGGRTQAFVEANWLPEKVAARFLQLAQGQIPGAWTADPDMLDYVGGWGLSDTQWRRQMGCYLSAVGEAGLSLSDRPLVRRRILDAAAGASIT